MWLVIDVHVVLLSLVDCIFSTTPATTTSTTPQQQTPSFNSTFGSQLDDDFISVVNKLEEDYHGDQKAQTEESPKSRPISKQPMDKLDNPSESKGLKLDVNTQIVTKHKRNELLELSNLDLTLSSPLHISTPTNTFRNKGKISKGERTRQQKSKETRTQAEQTLKKTNVINITSPKEASAEECIVAQSSKFVKPKAVREQQSGENGLSKASDAAKQGGCFPIFVSFTLQ